MVILRRPRRLVEADRRHGAPVATRSEPPSSDELSSACVSSAAAGRAFGRARRPRCGRGVFPGDGSEESLSARALPRAIAAWSFADAAATAALPSKCLSSAPTGATFTDDRRRATRFQDIVALWQRNQGCARQSIRLATPVQFTRDLRICGVRVTYRHGYFRSKFLPV